MSFISFCPFSRVGYLFAHKVNKKKPFHIGKAGQFHRSLAPMRRYILSFCGRRAHLGGKQRLFSASNFLVARSYFSFSARYFLLSAQKKFITNFVTGITNFVRCVTNFLTCVTNFVTKTFLYESKKYQAERENLLPESKKILGKNIFLSAKKIRQQSGACCLKGDLEKKERGGGFTCKSARRALRATRRGR